jgi:16S rRNA (cytidine1402-2'-O)-methyltransferase
MFVKPCTSGLGGAWLVTRGSRCVGCTLWLGRYRQQPSSRLHQLGVPDSTARVAYSRKRTPTLRQPPILYQTRRKGGGSTRLNAAVPSEPGDAAGWGKVLAQLQLLQAVERGRLYIVATPIGHLGDLSFRALAVLQQVDWIAAEDTRHTGKLLSHYGISLRKQVSHHEHNWREQVPFLLSQLETHRAAVALVCDAGTPLIADPGGQLVHEAIQRQVPVVAVPGACAAIAALTISGLLGMRKERQGGAGTWEALLGNSFAFYGFLPHRMSGHGQWRRQRHRLVETIIREARYRPVILYEAPHRLLETIRELAMAEQRVISVVSTTVVTEMAPIRICVARELTKLHEEVFRGHLREALERLEQQDPRGEYCLVLGPPDRSLRSSNRELLDSSEPRAASHVDESPEPPHAIDAGEARVHVSTLMTMLLREGLAATAVARCVARALPQLRRKEAYAMAVKLRQQLGNSVDHDCTHDNEKC